MNKTTGGIPPWRPLGKLETLRLWEQTTERVSSEQPYTDCTMVLLLFLPLLDCGVVVAEYHWQCITRSLF